MWYGHALRRPEKDVLMKAMVHEVYGKRKQGRPRIKWKEQVEGSMRRIGLRKEDATDWCRWREGIGGIASRHFHSLGIFKPE